MSRSTELILDRKKQGKVKIYVSYLDIAIIEPYRTTVFHKAKNKRKWINCVDEDDWNFRKLIYGERDIYIRDQKLKYVTEEELRQAKLKLWQEMKPE